MTGIYEGVEYQVIVGVDGQYVLYETTTRRLDVDSIEPTDVRDLVIRLILDSYRKEIVKRNR